MKTTKENETITLSEEKEFKKQIWEMIFSNFIANIYSLLADCIVLTRPILTIFVGFFCY